MEVTKCIIQRRSVRCYQEYPISAEDIHDILQSAIWALMLEIFKGYDFKLRRSIICSLH